jgi:type II secretory pathway pseudopilin PulG
VSRVHRHSLRGDQGTSLVEMLVTIIVVGLLTSAVALTVSRITHHTLLTKSRDFATEQAQVTMDRSSRYLRAAAPEGSGNPQTVFTLASDNHITFYSDLAQPNGPDLVDLNVTGPATGGTLIETVTPADATSVPPTYTYTGTSTTGRDGTDINTTAGAVFTFYNANGTVLTTPMTTIAQTSQIARVRVSVVDQEPGISTPVTDSTLIYLRNVEYAANS